MKAPTNARLRKQAGVVVSVELIFILTILVIGLVVGWVSLRNSVVSELGDVAEAVGSLDQSFTFPGTQDILGLFSTEGSAADDATDDDGADGAFDALGGGDGIAAVMIAPLPNGETAGP